MSEFLNAQDILGCTDNVVQRNMVTADNKLINIKRMSGSDHEKVAEFYASKTEGKRVKYKVFDYHSLFISLLVVGEDGKTPIFTYDDVMSLKGRDYDHWGELWKHTQEQNPTASIEEIIKAKENLFETQPESSDSK